MYEVNNFVSLNEEELLAVDGGSVTGVLIAAGLFLGSAVVVCGTVVLLAAGAQWVYNKLTN
jgi:glutamate synthase domain-containing protein 2